MYHEVFVTFTHEQQQFFVICKVFKFNGMPWFDLTTMPGD